MALHLRELTPRGAGAVSVLELCGDGAKDAVCTLGGVGEMQDGALRLLRLRAAGEDLDEALCVVHGSDHVELHLHGSPVLVARVIDALGGGAHRGNESAELEASAAERLGSARTEAAARVLLDQAEGALSRRLQELAGQEEAEARTGLEQLVERSLALAPVLSAPRVVLAGPVNAGKSTLFNVLVGSERAITSDSPGTTRDMLVGYASFGEIEYELIDTAGVREVEGSGGAEQVELEGQRAGELLREGAYKVFWVEDARAEAPASPDGCELLLTKADLLNEPPMGSISALADPLGARRELRSRLEQSGARWRAGEPVLFSPKLCAWGEEVLAGPLSALSTRLRAPLEG
ncbi:MAG: 50S ribosome-binding GTPase [Planctomycetes bacterium]|nr:50S ribosome-binding GTPase [Planctomycetota bacterium]